MKKILFNIIFIALIAIISVGCGEKQQPMDLYDSIHQRGKLVVGVSQDIEPFGFKDSEGQYQGLEIDLAKHIAKTLLKDENAIEFVSVEPSNRISMLNSGQADMIIATMTITPQRQAIVDFSEPYHFAGQTVMVLKNSSIKSLSDLKDKRIGVAFGTTSNDGIRTIAPSALISGYKTYQDAVNALLANEIDAFALDDTILLGYALKNNNLRILPQKYTQEPYGIAFRKGSESTRMLQMVNGLLSILKENGSLNKYKAKWLNK